MSFDPPRPAILIQLDTDPQPSVFDGVVAVDSGVAHLFRHGGVRPGAVRDLVHGALFTRAPADLKRTAVFVGGSDVAAGEAVFEAVQQTFFAHFRVSTLLDSNGANTTAAAAVLAALDGAGGSVEGSKAVVLGAGPVGRRVARLLLGQGAEVAIGAPTIEEAREASGSIRVGQDRAAIPFSVLESGNHHGDGVSIVIAAGPSGVTVLPKAARVAWPDLKVAIDLNAVPPSGIEGIEAADRDADRDGVRCWGALGVGGMKMKIHKAAIHALFEANDRALDAEQVFEIGRGLP